MTETAMDNRIWDSAETLPREELAALQAQRLHDTVERANTAPHYRRAFAETGVAPEDIRSLDDLRRLPFTVKDDLRESYPLGLLAVPREEVLRYHGSSGTTGKPTFVAYTRGDLERWADLCARFLVAGGLRPDHTTQIAFGYGLFTGGFGLHYGIERVGASIVPAAAGNTHRQLMLIQDLEAQVLICTPSYALTIADAAEEAGLDPAGLPLEAAHFGGEMWTEDMRALIEAKLGIKAYNNYGLSEVIGPGVAGECACQDGMHIQEDHFIVECIDPETLEPVEPGERGELVFTSLTKEAMPVIRYRTRDIASLDAGPCACGRSTARCSRITGRTDDMLILRGVNVFPSQIEEALLQVDGAAPHYLIEIDRPARLDEVTVHVEVNPQNFSDSMSEMQSLREEIDRKLYDVTGIRARVELVRPQSLERFTGKAVRVVDHRPEGSKQ